MTCRWCKNGMDVLKDRSVGIVGARFLAGLMQHEPIALQCARCRTIACEHHAGLYFRTVNENATNELRVCVGCWWPIRRAQLRAEAAAV